MLTIMSIAIPTCILLSMRYISFPVIDQPTTSYSQVPMPKQPVYRQRASRTYLRHFFFFYSESSWKGRAICSPLPGSILQPVLSRIPVSEQPNVPSEQNLDDITTHMDSFARSLKKPSGLMKANLQEVLRWTPEVSIRVQVMFTV